MKIEDYYSANHPEGKPWKELSRDERKDIRKERREEDLKEYYQNNYPEEKPWDDLTDAEVREVRRERRAEKWENFKDTLEDIADVVDFVVTLFGRR